MAVPTVTTVPYAHPGNISYRLRITTRLTGLERKALLAWQTQWSTNPDHGAVHYSASTTLAPGGGITYHTKRRPILPADLAADAQRHIGRTFQYTVVPLSPADPQAFGDLVTFVAERPAAMSGEELRASRQRLGLSQAQLGEWLSVPANTIYRWERGTLTIERPVLLRLALDRLADVLPRTSAQARGVEA